MPYLESNQEEKQIGLELFFTDAKGIGGRLKKQPEDFIVNERSLPVEPMPAPEQAKREKTAPLYTYARVRSRNWETNRLVIRLASQLNISFDKIFFAGSKDKRAITTQLMAFDAPLEAVKAVSLNDVELFDFFVSPRLLKIGNLFGNDFELYIRDSDITEVETKERIEDTKLQLEQINGFPNFFGVQRFGIIRPITHEAGKLMVKKEFEDAVHIYLGHPIEGEPIKDYEVRVEFEHCWDFEWALENYPHYLVFERILIRHLNRHPDDYIGALKQFPKNLSTMFIHAYQSYLFNRIICARIREGLPLNEPLLGDMVLPVDNYKLPVHKTWIPVTKTNLEKLTRLCHQKKAYTSGVLFGSESQFAEGDFGELEKKIIEEEGIKTNDFIIPEFPLLSSKGSRRELVAPVYDFKYHYTPEYIKLNFGLYKGVYATTLMREYMKSEIKGY